MFRYSGGPTHEIQFLALVTVPQLKKKEKKKKERIYIYINWLVPSPAGPLGFSLPQPYGYFGPALTTLMYLVSPTLM